jgi:two-component system, response regulator
VAQSIPARLIPLASKEARRIHDGEAMVAMGDTTGVEILLVEDNPMDLTLTLHALKQNTAANQVEVARDGEEALAFLFGPDGAETGTLRASPRMVLLDLKLPKVDGLEVLRRLKSDPVSRHVPVVVLTSSREDRDLEEAYALGANSYIVKPVDFEKFSEVIRHMGLYWLVVNQPRS